MNRIVPVAAIALLAAVTTVFAAGSDDSSSSSSSSASSWSQRDQTYDRAVRAVKAQRFEQARDLLEQVVRRQPRNADAWNWLGFSERNLGNVDGSLAAYERALAIDPGHRGALEYLGELYVRTGDLDKAREQLRKLDRACGLGGCEEYDELKAAIDRKTAGS